MEKLDYSKQSSFLTLESSFDVYWCLGGDAKLGGSDRPSLAFRRIHPVAGSMEKWSAALVVLASPGGAADPPH